MITREDGEGVICIEQNEHGLISGQLVHQWRDDLFVRPDLKPRVTYAITHHDRSWIPLDRKLEYSEEEGKVASFTEYPLKRKIRAYEQGVNQLLKEDVYAAYLISRHYASFFENGEEKEGVPFMVQEKQRQKHLFPRLLYKDISLTKEEETFHFDLLQLCDNLSLYLCMNPWGAGKEEEVSWFKAGFPQKLRPLNGEKFQAFWQSETEVKLTPFPFQTNCLHIRLPYKKLIKERLTRLTITDEYKKAPVKYHPIVITP
ncbi:DUF3891 family protein [Bacillus sp. A301a_S52]|nr:DUF3891 family protein [Bacillus sp. A301a_S52]